MAKTGGERLAEYRDRIKVKQNVLADLLGVTDSYLSQLLSGRRYPGLELALKIETVTGIQVNAWSASVRAKSDRRRARAAHKASVGSELTNGV